MVVAGVLARLRVQGGNARLRVHMEGAVQLFVLSLYGEHHFQQTCPSPQSECEQHVQCACICRAATPVQQGGTRSIVSLQPRHQSRQFPEPPSLPRQQVSGLHLDSMQKQRFHMLRRLGSMMHGEVAPVWPMHAPWPPSSGRGAHTGRPLSSMLPS